MRAKISVDFAKTAIVDVHTVGKGVSIVETIFLTKETPRKFIWIDFPEDSRLEYLINRRDYKNAGETVRLIGITTDDEIGGVFAEVSNTNLPAQRKLIPLKEFLDEYKLVEPTR